MNKKIFGFAMLGAGLITGITLYLYYKERKKMQEMYDKQVSLNEAISLINNVK